MPKFYMLHLLQIEQYLFYFKQAWAKTYNFYTIIIEDK